MTSVLENRMWLSAVLAIETGYLALARWQFPADAALLQIVLLHKPALYYGIKYAYVGMCFSTPFIIFSTTASLAYIFLVRAGGAEASAQLPPYPDPTGRETLYLVLGEVHHAKRPEPAANPPVARHPGAGTLHRHHDPGRDRQRQDQRLYVSLVAAQILGYRAGDAKRRIGGLVLEVKGDFCHKVRRLLQKHGRGGDYTLR